jgi:hypothetical protein
LVEPCTLEEGRLGVGRGNEGGDGALAGVDAFDPGGEGVLEFGVLPGFDELVGVRGEGERIGLGWIRGRER